MLLSDGWACYWSAFLRGFGEEYQPRRKKQKGRKKARALRIPSRFLYAQVVKRSKKAGKRWRLNSVVSAIPGEILTY